MEGDWNLILSLGEEREEQEEEDSLTGSLLSLCFKAGGMSLSTRLVRGMLRPGMTA